METDTERPAEQCPGCGRDLPETTPALDGYWYVTDGQPLGCGCAGGWSADGEGEGAWPNHNDEECMQCAQEEIDDLSERCARLERERDEATRRHSDLAETVVRPLQAEVTEIRERCARLERERDDARSEASIPLLAALDDRDAAIQRAEAAERATRGLMAFIERVAGEPCVRWGKDCALVGIPVDERCKPCTAHALLNEGCLLGEKAEQERDDYLDSILERPAMYAGPSVQALELVLVNLLNFRAIVFGQDHDPREILRKTYADRFGHPAGAGGPSSKLIERYGDDPGHPEIRAFYKAFVEAASAPGVRAVSQTENTGSGDLGEKAEQND